MKNLPQKATHQQTKAYNSQLVLKTIYDHGKISRAELSRLTHLTRTTVSELVTGLMEKGLVEEVGKGASIGGKIPILLSLVDDARHLIGLDLANDELRGAVLNLRGEVKTSINLPLQGCSGEDAIQLVYDLVDSLMASTETLLLGIGIGTPGLIDTGHGIVVRSVNLDWADLPLASLLQTRYNLPVYIANDSQAAAMAAYLFSGEPKSTNLVLIKIGQGVGAGIVINGQLYQGDGFGAGEIGHVSIAENSRLCRCGNLGCLETIASQRAIVERAREMAPDHPESSLYKLAAGPLGIQFHHILQAFAAGDILARSIALDAARALGISIAGLVGALNIRHIILVGAVTSFGPDWLEAICQQMAQRSLDILARDTRVELSSLGPDVVIRGASALLLTRELGLDLVR
jgi:predicted NBD/HSP70 family sugar kinase